MLVNKDYLSLLENNGISTLESLWDIQGEPVKKKLAERGTERVFLTSDESGDKVESYVKRYLPLPLKEYFKALTSFRPFFPSGAMHEWKAVLAFHEAGLSTMEPIAAGRFKDGRSVVMMKGITNYQRASDLLPQLQGDRRRRLILAIAEVSGKMHSAKIAHQDFYLVHLFVKKDDASNDFKVMPIDLQRLIIGPRFSRRWRVKDLGQLLYSAMEFTDQRDWWLFWRKYAEIAGDNLLKDKSLLASIFRKANAIRKRSLRKKAKRE